MRNLKIIKNLQKKTGLSIDILESIVNYTIDSYKATDNADQVMEPLAVYSRTALENSGEAISDHQNTNIMLSHEHMLPITHLFSQNTDILLDELINQKHIGTKFLAEKVFDMTQNTFRLYRNDNTKELSPRLKEIGFSILEIYQRGIELFGTKEAFENWLNKEHMAFGYVAPVNYISTMTGIQLINEELIRIEFGATA